MVRKIELSEVERYREDIKQIYAQALGYNESASDFLITRILKSDENKLNTLLIGAFEEDVLIGFAFGFDFKRGNWWADQIDSSLPTNEDWYKSSFEFNELAVYPNKQGKGHGQALMKKLMESVEHSYILLGTAKEENDSVIRFYHRLGFENLIDPFYYPGNEYSASIIMVRKQGV